MSNRSEKRDYSWISGYEKTWASIKEDSSGSLVSSMDKLARESHADLRAKRQNAFNLAVRHLYLVIDLSSAMLERDLHPSRIICTIKCLKNFVENFFDQNPLSQLGIITTSSSKAKVLSALSGGLVRHQKALVELENNPQCVGEPSIQNALLIAESRLKHMPSYSSREILLVMGSMTTCDPGDIHQTIQSLINNKIRCSVISLAVEVFVYKALAVATGGTLNVIMDVHHLKTLLQSFVLPPAVSANSDAALLRIGFPNSTAADFENFPVRECMCHIPNVELKGDASTNARNNENVSNGSRPQGNYLCPRCHAAYCELPIECVVCGITLMSAPHLARAYHHLFPLPQFLETPLADVPATGANGEALSCGGCAASLQMKTTVYKCPKCPLT
ncbi:hypothetical protein Aperf_G00000017788 [Anoplocephala perfoliata]